MNKFVLGFAAFIGFLLISNALFIVHQTEQAIVLEFGKPVQFKDGDKEVSFIRTPGLKLKIPFIQEVVFFDNRVLDFSATDKEVLDIEKKNLTVNAFAKYTIVDPLTFYEKVTDIRGINDRLDRIFEASLRDAIGSILLTQLLTGERKDVMDDIKQSVSEKAKDFGVRVFDVRIVRADLPPENSEAIYKRMRAEREKEAREHRAEGDKQGEIIRGKADADAIKILANAFNRDPEFYAFYRSMEAYRKSLSGSNTTLVISPDGEFLEYFGDIDQKRSR